MRISFSTTLGHLIPLITTKSCWDVCTLRIAPRTCRPICGTLSLRQTDLMLEAVSRIGGSSLNWSSRYPIIAVAVGKLGCRSCLVDGEVVICGEDGIPVFNRLRYGRAIKTEAVLFAFDLLE